MPLYFLDVVAGDVRHEDPDGTEHESVHQARDEAHVAIRELVANDIRAGRRLDLQRRIEIRDQTGGVSACVYFSDAIPL
jgi:hypothetical protein